MSALMMRIAGLEGYQALVSELGGDAISLIEEAELQLDSFNQPDYLIPAWKACKLLELSAEHLITSNFGLLLAKRQNLSMLGPLGLMLQHSETLEHALQDLNKFLYVHSQAGNINLSSNGNLVNITYSPLVSYHNSAKQLIDLSLAVGFSILSSLSNRRFPLVSAYFTYKTPDDAAIYRDFFACPVIFSAAENGVTILRSVLENSLTQQKQDVRGFFNDYLKNKENALRPGINESLRILIRQLLPLGKCRLDIVSSALAIDKRTLQRRLKEIDTSFKALVDIERKQIAMQYIKESDLSMAQISDLLGYTDPSIFSRNFKSWFGLAPAEYLKAHRFRWKYRS